MKLPNGAHAVVEDAKLLEYVLSPTHPVGKHHAVLFERLLGVTAENADVLRDALLHAAETEEISREATTPFGHKYEMRFDFAGPRGVKTVLAVWIIESETDYPRLVTCFVE